MKYFFRSPEIYIKLRRSSEYPTNLDTPLVPIRGLWVAGIHRSIFDIDHAVMVTDIDSTKVVEHDYTTSSSMIKDEGCAHIGIVMYNSHNVPVQKYTKSSSMVKDEGCAHIGIVMLNSHNLPVQKYTTSHHTFNDEGCAHMGIIVNAIKPNYTIYHETKYSAMGDAQGLFVSAINSTPATVTDVNE